MCSETIFIAGRYNKYLRNLSQSPWVDKDDVRIRDSVQELIENGLKRFLSFDKGVFSSSGREDVDVRMLGTGRPFVFKVLNPFNTSNYNKETMKQIQEFINMEYNGTIKVRDLQIVTKESVTKNLKEGEESKSKQYRALCCCSRTITQDDIDRISSITDLMIDQKTPIRVLHRRSWAVRKRRVYSLKIDRVKLDDFESVKSDNIDNVFQITLTTEAGTYIKEFVHSDFGRTTPSLSSLLGDCETDLMELDVMEVYLNWPPSLEESKFENTEARDSYSNNEDFNCSYSFSKMRKTTNLSGMNEIIGSSETTTTSISDNKNLEELYTEGLNCFKKAESMQRGDARQNLYINSRRLFNNAMNLVENLQLFSDNEALDDITTINLKYLLIPSYLAKIALSSECPPSGRLETFTRAEKLITSFFHRILKYDLIEDDNDLKNRIEKAIRINEENETNDKQNIDDISKPTVSSQSLDFAMLNRTEKIENYKKMKILEDKIIELEKQINSGKDFDDEIAREYYINLIRKTISDCYESLIGEVKPAINFERQRKTIDKATTSEEKPPSLIQSQNDNSMGKTFTIVKNDLQKQVFGLGYPSRPTVTVNEFINKKMKDGELSFQTQKEVYANSLQRYAEKPDLLRQQEELSDAEHDEKEDKDDVEELIKKRRWDEFKDENPRGSGNRHNMG